MTEEEQLAKEVSRAKERMAIVSPRERLAIAESLLKQFPRATAAMLGYERKPKPAPSAKDKAHGKGSPLRKWRDQHDITPRQARKMLKAQRAALKVQRAYADVQQQQGDNDGKR